MIISTPSTSGLSLWDMAVQNGKAFAMSQLVTPTVGDLAQLGLENPPASGKNVIVNSIHLGSNNTETVTLYLTPTVWGTVNGSPTRLSTGNLDGVAQGKISLNGSVAALSVGIDILSLSNLSTLQLNNINISIPVGWTLYTLGAAVTQTLFWGIYWMEL